MPSNIRSTCGQDMMWQVFAVKTASASTFGNGLSTSSSMGFATHLRMSARFSARSLACQARCGSSGAKYAACWPVPEPISSTDLLLEKTRFRTARIGARLRSLGSEKGFMADAGARS